MSADHTADTIASPAQHRGWSVKMIAWSAALAAVLLAGAWGAANWRAFHLVYCRHLLSSPDGNKQFHGMELIEKHHLHEGMTLEEVQKVVAPFQLRKLDLSPDEEGGEPPAAYLAGDMYLEFDSHGQLTDWEVGRDI